jgi:hypothetical protein
MRLISDGRRSLAASAGFNSPNRALAPKSPARELHMLELRPNCECCDIDLPAQSAQARICSFECTFCASCAETVLRNICPNCGGELMTRPRRPVESLAKSPASTRRVFKPAGCMPGAAARATEAGRSLP